MAVMGLLPGAARATGSALFQGGEILGLAPNRLNRIRGSKLTMVFQDPMTSLAPHLKIGVQLAEVLVHHRGLSWRDAERAAFKALDRCAFRIRSDASSNILMSFPGVCVNES